jgi:integrase
MSIYKRGKTWWTDFSVNGQRFRESLDTADWREAQSQQKELIAQASAGKLAPSSRQFARLAFSEAADRYLDTRKLELSKRSLSKERQLLVHPRKFFGAMSLARISAENLLEYRDSRASEELKPSYLNMEMGAIRRILKRAKRWHIVADDIRPLKERRNVGRALLPEEKSQLLRIADSRPEWNIARLAATLSLNTTMRGCELKGLKWRDVDLNSGTVTIRRSKTDAGERVIPLNGDAMSAILELFERAEKLNAAELDHYVFPACENGTIDPERAQESWRTSWRRLTRSIDCPKCNLLQNPGQVCRGEKCKADIRKIQSPLAGLRFHDLRHHAITELAESQASDQTTMAIAGHVSMKMLSHYSHVRLEAKRTALNSISSRPAAAASTSTRNRDYVTKDGTKSELRSKQRRQVVERNGRLVGTRTPDLYRVKVAL